MGMTTQPAGLPGVFAQGLRHMREMRRCPPARWAGSGVSKSQSGQMTVELAVAFPVLIIVAVIAVNACAFFVDCAVFDRVASDAIRVHSASPAYRQATSQSCALIEQEIASALDADNVDVSVTCSAAGFNMERFTATMEFAPTLFGMGLRSRVFGVALPHLMHSTSLVVDVYKPGVVL